MFDGDYQAHAWNLVKHAVLRAKAMHYDGCHKIYLSMDDAQVEAMKGYGYDIVTPDFDKLKEWYDESAKTCGLQSVSAVYTINGNVDNPDGFDSLIPQFFEPDDDDD